MGQQLSELKDIPALGVNKPLQMYINKCICKLLSFNFVEKFEGRFEIAILCNA